MRTTRALVEVVHRRAGQPPTRLRQMPILLRAVALTTKTVREPLEMGYQFEKPFVVDNTDVTTPLGAVATPMERGLEQTDGAHRRATAV